MSERPSKQLGPVGVLRHGRRLRWMIIAAVVAAIAYPLSVGPVDYFFFYGKGPARGDTMNPTQSFFVRFFAPLRWIDRYAPKPVGAAFDAYEEWWWGLAKRHAAAKTAPVAPPVPAGTADPALDSNGPGSDHSAEKSD